MGFNCKLLLFSHLHPGGKLGTCQEKQFGYTVLLEGNSLNSIKCVSTLLKRPLIRCPAADKWIRKPWYIYTMEYYSAIKKNAFESVLMRWMKLEPIIQSEVNQMEKHQYSILMHIYGI